MLAYLILTAPPWHWWIAVNLLILDGILLIGLGILYCKVAVAPARSMRDDPVVGRPSHDGVLDRFVEPEQDELKSFEGDPRQPPATHRGLTRGEGR